mgnify:CR=1 FL=1
MGNFDNAVNSECIKTAETQKSNLYQLKTQRSYASIFALLCVEKNNFDLNRFDISDKSFSYDDFYRTPDNESPRFLIVG